jgi:hypothetical protein
VAYFDGSAAGTAVLTLSLWAALGLAAVLTGARRGGRPAVAAERREAAPVPVG